MISWEDLVPVGVERERRLSETFGKDVWLVRCTHDPGFRREHGGGEADACRVCGGMRSRTDDFKLPVRLMAVIRGRGRDHAAGLTLF